MPCPTVIVFAVVVASVVVVTFVVVLVVVAVVVAIVVVVVLRCYCRRCRRRRRCRNTSHRRRRCRRRRCHRRCRRPLVWLQQPSLSLQSPQLSPSLLSPQSPPSSLRVGASNLAIFVVWLTAIGTPHFCKSIKACAINLAIFVAIFVANASHNRTLLPGNFRGSSGNLPGFCVIFFLTN